MNRRSPAGVASTAALFLTLLVSAASTKAAEFYVSPTAVSGGNGSIGNPWRLQTALDHPATVDPGDTIWLRGGIYTGAPFTSHLQGTSANPIIVRQYPGERARIDGNYNGNETTLVIQGKYTWFWDFEVFNSDPTRFSSNGKPPRRGPGTQLSGIGTRMINMIVHDTTQGVLTGEDSTDTRIYGTLFYYNGYDAPDRGHGHGIYAQNQGATPRKIYDNIIFDQFGWGIHAYSEGGHLDHLDFEGNVSFNNGSLSGGYHANILVGGTQHQALAPKLISNYTYNFDQQNKVDVGYSAGCASPSVTNNYFVSGLTLDMNACSSMTISGNTFYGSISGFSQSGFPSNTYHGSNRPTGTKVFLRPNAYEPGRAHVVIYNWDLEPTVVVDLSSFLVPGAAYALRNAQNPFGAPVVSGTYDGTPITVPMIGLLPATPVGVPARAPTGPEFNVFILTSTPGAYEFFDVPQSHLFHNAIHTLAANGVTSGCGFGNFCPGSIVTRAQMAVFLLKSSHGPAYLPPDASGNVFDDVPANAFGAAWIERLAAEGIASGCGSGDYCPDASVTRAQMAVFLLKSFVGSGYAPPSATGTVFSDVPANAFAAAWIEELADRGITSGCGGGKYCPSGSTTRGQMAAFLVTTFNLQ